MSRASVPGAALRQQGFKAERDYLNKNSKALSSKSADVLAAEAAHENENSALLCLVVTVGG